MKIYDKCINIIENEGCILLSNNPDIKKYKIKCINGHIFYRNYKKIYQKKLCKKCKFFKKENICRYILEKMLNCEFKKIRPKWLKNPKTNRLLELDGYNENLKIGFEYDGEFHYSKNKSKKYTNSRLNSQKERDGIKDKLCEQNNIKLIRIPYFIKKNNIQEYIQNICITMGITIINYTKIDINNIKNYHNKIKEIQDYIAEYDIKLLSSTYLNSKHKLEFMCVNNHIFYSTYYNIQKRKNKCILCRNTQLKNNT